MALFNIKYVNKKEIGYKITDINSVELVITNYHLSEVEGMSLYEIIKTYPILLTFANNKDKFVATLLPLGSSFKKGVQEFEDEAVPLMKAFEQAIFNKITKKEAVNVTSLFDETATFMNLYSYYMLHVEKIEKRGIVYRFFEKIDNFLKKINI